MRALMLRRLLVWSVLAVSLVVLILALVIVWTANEREWYIDSAGVSATLDMTLSNTGRWIATAALGALILLVVLAFVVELATANAGQRALRQRPVIHSLEERTAPRAHPIEMTPGPAQVEPPTERLSTPRFASTVVGNDTTRRMERSLPASEPIATDAGDGRPETERMGVDDTDRRATVRLRPIGRR